MTQYKDWFKPTQIKLAVNACGELKIVRGGLVHGQLLSCSLPGWQHPPAPPQCRGQVTCLPGSANGKIPLFYPFKSSPGDSVFIVLVLCSYGNMTQASSTV